MVQIVFAETVLINTVITKQAQKFKNLACKARGGVFSPKLKGKAGINSGISLGCWNESKERSGIAWLGFLFETNTHMHTCTHLAWFTHLRRRKERGEEEERLTRTGKRRRRTEELPEVVVAASGPRPSLHGSGREK